MRVRKDRFGEILDLEPSEVWKQIDGELEKKMQRNEKGWCLWQDRINISDIICGMFRKMHRYKNAGGNEWSHKKSTDYRISYALSEDRKWGWHEGGGYYCRWSVWAYIKKNWRIGTSGKNAYNWAWKYRWKQDLEEVSFRRYFHQWVKWRVSRKIWILQKIWSKSVWRPTTKQISGLSWSLHLETNVLAMNGGLVMSYTFCEKKVGEKLHELRMRKKLKQREAADEMHISREHYSRIENGTRRISLEMLFILMNFYGEDAKTILCIKDGKYVEWDV